ncbi:ENHANCER OF AG-4 protein 2 [Camellia lanceoleosa]|uniref:ENHANCER OF AG-4 protein 2 n=1 Tax=Camellia lanceoleosa TaxID=1840588 RepID=A0ACC0GJC2_9ERIC|nr:ENHANCER OF AG-4 protein 2 [Camellia lanceoleosa]
MYLVQNAKFSLLIPPWLLRLLVTAVSTNFWDDALQSFCSFKLIIVQAALPHLLGAAASPGVAARENRRQCLKVLRLWLERKILPESLLHQYMDDIRVSNDDASAGFFLRRPSRAERAVDDPIRDMEGMLVDEYGRSFLSCLCGLECSQHMLQICGMKL